MTARNTRRTAEKTKSDATAPTSDDLSKLTVTELRELRDRVNVELSGRNTDTGEY